MEQFFIYPEIKNMVSRNLSGRIILILFILTNIVYLAMVMGTIPNVMTFANGMKLLDMLPMGYSAVYVNSLLTTLGPDGRNAYLFLQLPLDFIYPGLFGITYCLLFAFLITKLGKQDSNLFYISYVALYAMVFDYMENIGIISMIIEYPSSSTVIANLTSVCSMLKSSLTIFYFIALVLVSFALGVQHIQKQTSDKTVTKP